MTEIVNTETPHAGTDARAKTRRALAVGEAADVGALREKLAACGYEVRQAAPREVARAAAEGETAVVLFVFGEREREGELVAAARRLRSTAETFALPLVFLYRTDERTLRSAALNVGADDYFALAASNEEIGARLEALRWRTEAARRAAPLVADQLSEIDNFLLLLDAVGRDTAEGEAQGTLALAGLAGDAARAAEAEQERALAAAHGFLKLNLRRVEAVAFYGPTTLLVYLPRVDERTAEQRLTRLRKEFAAARTGVDLAVGLVSFDAAGDDKVEALVEKAEHALVEARSNNSLTRVVAYSTGEELTTVSRRARPAEVTEEAEASKTEPRADAASQTTTTREATVPSSLHEAERTQRTAAREPRRLLLAVSDAARMAQVNLLMRSAGYEVRAAFDGQQALNLLRIERPDLVLVDYALNDMDGAEMLRRFRRQSGARSKAAVVLMIPGGLEAERAAAFEAGARAVVGLPYDPAELLEVVRSHGAAEE